MQEYFKILGLPQNATDEEIEAAYSRLKDRYLRERFEEGEKGNEAAKNLTKLETAYMAIKEARLHNGTESKRTPEDFSEIEELIKKGKISDAQEMLDNVNERTAEWHYLQSVVYYKKNWISDSKKQLEIAMNMEPGNKKYADSYTKLKQKMEFNEKQFQSGNAGYSGNAAPNNENQQMGGSGVNECCSFCTTWCCMNMLCSMCCR